MKVNIKVNSRSHDQWAVKSSPPSKLALQEAHVGIFSIIFDHCLQELQEKYNIRKPIDFIFPTLWPGTSITQSTISFSLILEASGVESSKSSAHWRYKWLSTVVDVILLCDSEQQPFKFCSLRERHFQDPFSRSKMSVYFMNSGQYIEYRVDLAEHFDDWLSEFVVKTTTEKTPHNASRIQYIFNQYF